ncbi:MAG TPA: hypothetical protein PLI27_08250 [Ignavibacteriales bacterium]|nr:hypothetical protein [Ignavibacteriales bacterium]HOL80604.1 hypothetical protein [Ignavibacteriales bacterium]HOM64292.1 hypothetical protein [Ignavibacteriales bacterium]HPD68048.1 hypothetical protein [Ignavibacteriales bacterium]HPP33062.1 hypothetical protein [Ignavibacteriales bacterium]
MLFALIYTAHIIFLLVIFTKKWQNESIQDGLLNILLIIVLFSVGGAVTNMIANVIIPKEGIKILYVHEKYNIIFDRATFALLSLSIAEYFFYKSYYKKDFISNEMGK